MDFSKLINQVLGSAQSSGGNKTNSSNLIGILGSGAAASGLLSLFMKKGSVGKLARAGSMAALGALAYSAYQNWQNSKTDTPAAADNAQTPLLNHNAFRPENAEAQAAGRIILRTMIAAAAADGQIDEHERAAILQESGEDAETRQWLNQEATRPATPAELAAEIGGNTALAAESYLAARLVCAELSRKEIVFLAQLSEALKLDNKLVEQLEKQAGF